MKNVHLRRPTTMYVSGILPKYKVTMAEEKKRSLKNREKEQLQWGIQRR